MRTDTLWIGILIFATSLSVSSIVPEMVGYLIVLGVYVAFVGMLVFTDRFAVVYHWAILPLIVLIWLVFILATILHPTVAGLLRVGAFTVITGVNLFVIPSAINRTVLHDVIAYLSGLFVIISLPTVLLGPYEIAGLSIKTWPTTRVLAGIVLHTPLSLFDNPNYLTGFAAFGTVASAAMYTRSYTKRAAGLIGLNTLGVVLAGGRAALLSLVVAVTLYFVYRHFGRNTMEALIAIGVFVVAVGFAMIFGIVPGLHTTGGIDLSGRRTLWSAAYEAVLHRPRIGWGPGNDQRVLDRYTQESIGGKGTHNSYLRMFLISGIIGGVSYLVISAITVVSGLRNIHSETLFTFLLLVMFFILQLFAGMTIFGLSLFSTLGALFVGYTQSLSSSTHILRFNIDKYSELAKISIRGP